MLRNRDLLIAALMAMQTAVLAEQQAARVSQPAPRTRAPAMADAELEKNIRERFSRSKIAKNNFQVQGAVATLTGNTDVIQHKGTATRLAKSAGAKRVVNHIRVSEAAQQKASSNLAQGRRRAQVKRSEAATRPEKR